MKNTFDLQIQSTASDGKHTSREIVKMAKEGGLHVIALTDHDTTAGIEEALSAGSELDVRVIPGIEISVKEHGVHILGFGIDHTNEALHAELEKSKQRRLDGARATVENLKRAGFVIEWEDVLRERSGDVVARPHIARAVMHRAENKKILSGVTSVHDFIERFIANDNPNYVKRKAMSAREAIRLIHIAGGAAVWSHPALHFHGHPEELEEFLKSLTGWEIDGMEAMNPSHTEDDVELVLNLVMRYQLIATAGSDFHEKGDHSADFSSGLHSARFVGDYETYGFATDDMVEKLDHIIAKRK